ncbi:hypothetical protein ACH4C6_28785 [Streptomyces sp. NPDC017943]|uniref:hypothetical protein n=1 Tax=Streptomyces sp. NPDC017943 TaxID=3365019 RepID=UPI00378F8FE6
MAASTVVTALLPLVAGCGGGHDDSDPRVNGTEATAGQQGGSENAGKGKGAFPDKGVIITALCSVPATKPASVTVTGWNPTTWEQTVSRTFTVPAEAVVAEADDVASPLVELCANNFPDVGTSEDGPRTLPATRLRQLFDEDFSRMAVVLIDRQTEATGVGYVDTSGKLTKLSAEQGDDFGDTPREENAVFARNGSALWFTETDSSDHVRIASRSVTGDHAVTQQAGGDGEYMDGAGLALAGDPARGLFGKEVRVSPGGRRATAFITWQGYNVVDTPQRSALLTAKGVTAASIPVGADCHPNGWVDNKTVLCGPRNGEAKDPKRKKFLLDAGCLSTRRHGGSGEGCPGRSDHPGDGSQEHGAGHCAGRKADDFRIAAGHPARLLCLPHHSRRDPEEDHGRGRGPGAGRGGRPGVAVKADVRKHRFGVAGRGACSGGLPWA